MQINFFNFWPDDGFEMGNLFGRSMDTNRLKQQEFMAEMNQVNEDKMMTTSRLANGTWNFCIVTYKYEQFLETVLTGNKKLTASVII